MHFRQVDGQYRQSVGQQPDSFVSGADIMEYYNRVKEDIKGFWGSRSVIFSIFRHEGSYARRICKGAFHSPGKKSPVLASLVRYFLPFALDKYSVLRWQVFRKKEKKCCSLAGCPLCHFVTGICPHDGRPAPIKYQVLLEHPRLQTRKSLYSVLTLFSLFPRVRLAF